MPRPIRSIYFDSLPRVHQRALDEIWISQARLTPISQETYDFLQNNDLVCRQVFGLDFERPHYYLDATSNLYSRSVQVPVQEIINELNPPRTSSTPRLSTTGPNLSKTILLTMTSVSTCTSDNHLNQHTIN